MMDRDCKGEIPSDVEICLGWLFMVYILHRSQNMHMYVICIVWGKLDKIFTIDMCFHVLDVSFNLAILLFLLAYQHEPCYEIEYFYLQNTCGKKTVEELDGARVNLPQ